VFACTRRVDGWGSCVYRGWVWIDAKRFTFRRFQGVVMGANDGAYAFTVREVGVEVS